MSWLVFDRFSSEEERLMDFLLGQGLIDGDQQRILLHEHKKTGRRLEKILLDLENFEEESVVRFFAHANKIPFQSLKAAAFETLPWEYLPIEVAWTCCAVPFHCDGNTLTVVIADLSDLKGQDTLRCCLKNGLHLKLALGVRSEILTLLHKGQSDTDFQTSFSQQLKQDDQVISHFLKDLIQKAIIQGSSDIHFEPQKLFIRVRLRCDGVLETTCCFHISLWSSVCVQLKVLSQMDIGETRRPQDGRFSLSLMGQTLDIRAACHPTYYGENIVLRLLQKEKGLKSLAELGYSPQEYDAIKLLLKKPEGLLVLTGPTGCGKTTSLYAMLSLLNFKEQNIMTLEEPIEYVVPGIRQTEIKEGGVLTFSKGVQSLLRQDPDVILIGEIRHEDVAYSAIRAAMTGHSVLTTLHTVHALGVIYRLLEFKIPMSLISGLLNGVISQRLVRILCPHCKEPDPEIKLQGSFYKAKGCPLCQGRGYRGRTVVAEILIITPDIEERILKGHSYTYIKQMLCEKGFLDLQAKGLQLAARGITSLQEIQRVIGA